jgi:predicted phosphodiesterase
MSKEDFTESQKEVLNCLPDTRANISDKLGISIRAVRGRMTGIEEKGGALQRDRDDVWYWDGGENIHRITSRNKGTVTKKANEHLSKVEKMLKNVLKRTEPAISPPKTEVSHEDVVIHRSDDHIGQVRYNDDGEEVYNTEIAIDRIREITQKTISLIDRELAANREFDNCHLLLGGDTVTNENIYDHQPFNIDETLDRQIEIGVEVYFEQIALLSERFDTVQVVCQAGNHGEIRASGQSKHANADDIVYGMLDQLVRVSGMDNIHFVRNDSTKYTNFEMRGFNGHLRHGQNALNHIGTASGQNRWRGWALRHNYDIAYRGHYHEFKIEHVHNRPVLMSGSICPPGDFEESLSLWGEPAATIHGVSDERPMTWLYPIHFE